MSRVSAAALLVAASVVAGSCVATVAQGAEASPAPPRAVIGKATAFGAPTGKDGGISNPFVYCTGGKVEPRVRWVLTHEETGEKETFRWTGSLPNVAFPRVEPGHYISYAVARCGDARATRRQGLEVLQKTAETTISRAEFKEIKDGMTRRQVKGIVGYGGKSLGDYENEHGRSYDLMPFWRWSIVVFTDGLVTDKLWDVAHD
jgi:hypothetical protein